jgi:uncharacterized protein (UPF0332 family)
LEPATKELIKGYMEKADKKLKAARRLPETGDYEDAVSRAYYAVYHAAQSLLLSANPSHGSVINSPLIFLKKL